MAFRKPIDVMGTGHVDDYWRITGVVFDLMEGYVLATVQGYKDEAARLAGMRPHAKVEFRFTPQEFGGPLHSATLSAIYAAIKADPRQPVFADADDAVDVTVQQP